MQIGSDSDSKLSLYYLSQASPASKAALRTAISHGFNQLPLGIPPAENDGRETCFLHTAHACGGDSSCSESETDDEKPGVVLPATLSQELKEHIRITIDMTHAIKILQEHNFKHHGSCFKLQRSQIKRWQADVGTSVERCSAKRQSMPKRWNAIHVTEILTERQDKKLPEFNKAQSDDYSRSDDNESNTYYYYFVTSVLLQREPTRSPRSSNICPVLFTILVIQASPVTDFAPRVCSVSLPSLSHIPIKFSVLSGYFGAV